jgi:hypothetical protein
MKYKEELDNNLSQLLNNKTTAIEIYINVLNKQLDTLPNDSKVYQTIQACKELAESILTYDKTK